MVFQTKLVLVSDRRKKYIRVFLGLLITASLQILVKAECFTFGCSLTAADILYDDSTREALSVLRQTQPKPSYGDENGDVELSNDEKLSVKRKEALSKLKVAGDSSKTALTLRGYKGGKITDQINQDRALIVSPMGIVLPDSSKQKPMAQLLGVFDGHGGGGEKTSQYAVQHMPSLLATKLAAVLTDDSDAEAEAETGQQTKADSDKDFAVVQALKEAFDELDKNDPTLGNAGCTATVVLRLGQQLFVANAGDSVSFIGAYVVTKAELPPTQKRVQIVYQSREDKPDLPEERARIVAAGGYVHIPPNGNGDVPRAYYIDENRRARYGLAMSRSLGDWKVQGVTAEPIVDVLDLDEIVQKALSTYAKTCSGTSDDDEKSGYCDALDRSDVHIFATSISDGMMDYLSPDDIGQALATAFFDAESGLHPHSAAEDLIMQAAKGWDREYQGGYRDDIAIASFIVPLH